MRKFLFLIFFLTSATKLFAQTPIKDAMNSFALYNKSKNFGDLENAKKFIDNSFKTKKDSSSYIKILNKTLIYSALAYTDSTRKLKYVKDPIDETLFNFSKLKKSKGAGTDPEITFIKKNLSNAFLKRANNYLNSYDYENAFDSFRWVDSLSSGAMPLVKHNLAVISNKMGYRSRSIGYYEQLIKTDKTAIPDYYLTLAYLYEQAAAEGKALEVVQKGKVVFPKNRDLLFKELNFFVDKGDYKSIVPTIPAALELEPDNINLNYIAASAFDISEKAEEAEKYYKKVLLLDPNNYDANYSLGLLYLKLYNDKPEKQLMAGTAGFYLNKAYEINPNGTNVLKLLAILYRKSGETSKLESINRKLKQTTIN